MKKTFNFGPWLVEYTAEDGARLNRLCFNEYDLLTTEPKIFNAPSKDYGAYETRPVYGYDDCFPSVESCMLPQKNWEIPDHGELCWLKWNTSINTDSLVFTVKSKASPLIFRRKMTFNKNEINWIFEVKNEGDQIFPFQHVMHPLMRLDELSDFELPGFEKVYNEISHLNMELKNPREVKEYLFNQSTGTANMLFLQNIIEGEMRWKYKNGINLKVIFLRKLFPSIGIWWNNSGYPDEDGCRRNECAFEPIPGLNSVLSANYENKMCLSVSPGKIFSWQIKWRIV